MTRHKEKPCRMRGSDGRCILASLEGPLVLCKDIDTCVNLKRDLLGETQK
jgi:hypothetical protein